jgi:uncharacterized membrane protein
MALEIARPTIPFLLLTILLFSMAAVASSYQYIRLGEKADSTATPVAGTAMMGGSKDLDEAFRWLCKKANGGIFWFCGRVVTMTTTPTSTACAS